MEIVFGEEDSIAELLSISEADIALLNPLSYGKLLLNGEYDLIPTTCISTLSYTDLEKIYFGNNLIEINSLGLPEPNNFLEIITKVILQEKYNFEVTSNLFEGSAVEALDKFNAILTNEKISDNFNSLDLTEEWFDTFEHELPLGFWVARPGENSELLTQITREISAQNLSASQSVQENVSKSNTSYEREGEIKYTFDTKTEEAIDNILELLYQLGYLEEMTDAKISMNNIG